MSYKALVCRVRSLRPIEGADRIRLATVGAYQVIVGVDVEEGQMGLFFEQGGQLSEGFAQVNDLVRRKLEDGTRAGGMFEENRRVKAVKMRGVKSEGFWCPLTLLGYTGYDAAQLKDGDQFDALGDHEICNKYVTPATRARMATGKAMPRREVPMFAKHIETDQFKHCAGMIPKGAILYITEKLHGTSFRYGNVLDEWQPSGWRQRLGQWIDLWTDRLLGFNTEYGNWTHLNGTRNTILGKFKGEDYYGSDDFRQVALADVVLKKGEVLYGELVGYTRSGAPIMGAHSTADLKDKSVSQQFGDQFTYKYGCVPGQCRVFVYRITQVNEDGQAVELSWTQVVGRCRELGLEPVPHIAGPVVYDGDLQGLTDWVSCFTDGRGSDALPSTLDPSHIREGVVVRHESECGIGWLKSKSYTFGRLEGYIKEKDDYVDVEEAA